MHLTRELGEQIAAHLTPGPWANVQDENHRGDYEHGKRLALRYAGDDTSLHGAQITGVIPYRAPHLGLSIEWTCHMWGPDNEGFLVERLPYAVRAAWPGSSINISTTKTPERIGRELSKRLLSYYLPAYREGRAELQRERDAHAADGALAIELSTMAGTKVLHLHTHMHNHTATMPWRVNAGPLGMARLTCQGGKVRAEAFTMTPDQARQLVRLVSTWKGSSPLNRGAVRL